MKASAPVPYREPLQSAQHMVAESAYHLPPMMLQKLVTTVYTAYETTDEPDVEFVRRFFREVGVPESALVGIWFELHGFLLGSLGDFRPSV